MVPFSEVSLPAVVAGTLVAMFLGMAWYSPKAFGTVWAKLTGVNMDEAAKDMKRAFGTGILATFIGVYFIAVLLTMASPPSLQEALKWVVLLWLATIVPAELSGVAWERRPMQLLYINAGYTLVMFALVVTVLMKMPW